MAVPPTRRGVTAIPSRPPLGRIRSEPACQAGGLAQFPEKRRTGRLVTLHLVSPTHAEGCTAVGSPGRFPLHHPPLSTNAVRRHTCSRKGPNLRLHAESKKIQFPGQRFAPKSLRESSSRLAFPASAAAQNPHGRHHRTAHKVPVTADPPSFVCLPSPRTGRFAGFLRRQLTPLIMLPAGLVPFPPHRLPIFFSFLSFFSFFFNGALSSSPGPAGR